MSGNWATMPLLPRLCDRPYLASDLARLFIEYVLGNSLVQALSENMNRLYSAFVAMVEVPVEESVDRKCWSGPRIRSWREILNRQQAQKNYADRQLRGLGLWQLVKRAILHAVLVAYWAIASFHDRKCLGQFIKLATKGLAHQTYMVNRAVPVVARKGEIVLESNTTPDRLHHRLRRAQHRIDTGQAAVTYFLAMKLVAAEGDNEEWSEEDWLCTADTIDDISEDIKEMRLLLMRVILSDAMSRLMLKISWDFAVFYFWTVWTRCKMLMTI
jgi:hypothetical protein